MEIVIIESEKSENLKMLNKLQTSTKNNIMQRKIVFKVTCHWWHTCNDATSGIFINSIRNWWIDQVLNCKQNILIYFNFEYLNIWKILSLSYLTVYQIN